MFIFLTDGNSCAIFILITKVSILIGHLTTGLESEPLVKGVGCDGDENQLSECDLYSSYPCSGAAAITCYNSDEGMVFQLSIYAIAIYIYCLHYQAQSCMYVRLCGRFDCPI